MQLIPLNAVASQSVAATLGGQAVRVNVYQKLTGLFCDVLVNEQAILVGVLCHNLCLIVRSVYLNFVGDLSFIDTQGLADPVYTGLGTRYTLAYLEAADIEIIGINEGADVESAGIDE